MPNEGYAPANNVPSLVCDICGKLFITSSGLTKHIALRHKVNDAFSTFECQICKMQFTTKGHYEGHMNAHNDIKPHQCSRCNKAYSYRSSMLRHSLICSGQRESERKVQREFQCEICGQICHRKDTLKDHMAGKHGSETKEYVCRVCNMTFTWRSSLARHVQSKSHKKRQNND